jgi:hypothetical protein
LTTFGGNRYSADRAELSAGGFPAYVLSGQKKIGYGARALDSEPGIAIVSSSALNARLHEKAPSGINLTAEGSRAAPGPWQDRPRHAGAG